MTSVFGDLHVRIDPWEVDYGDQTPLATTGERQREEVNHKVEVDDAGWRAIEPPEGTLPYQRTIFIDGVRRLEARILVREDERLIHGAFGSFAVGAVELEQRSAAFGEMQVSRTAVLGSGKRLPDAVWVRPNLLYESRSTGSIEADGPLRDIQDRMRRAEARLAGKLCREDTLVIVDGPLPLSFEQERQGVALGYIKRLHQLYLPPRALPLLATLQVAARTPIFSIRSKNSGFARFSWFQRLAEPGPGVSEMHGLVRLEVLASVGLDRARELADAATSWLPLTAPKRARDPRAPQNLLPIGALEQMLRTRLGDGQLFRRWLGSLVARQAVAHD